MFKHCGYLIGKDRLTRLLREEGLILKEQQQYLKHNYDIALFNNWIYGQYTEVRVIDLKTAEILFKDINKLYQIQEDILYKASKSSLCSLALYNKAYLCIKPSVILSIGKDYKFVARKEYNGNTNKIFVSNLLNDFSFKKGISHIPYSIIKDVFKRMQYSYLKKYTKKEYLGTIRISNYIVPIYHIHLNNIEFKENSKYYIYNLKDGINERYIENRFAADIRNKELNIGIDIQNKIDNLKEINEV